MPQYYTPDETVAPKIQNFVKTSLTNYNPNFVYQIILKQTTACTLKPNSDTVTIKQRDNTQIGEGLYYYQNKFFIIYPDDQKSMLYKKLSSCFTFPADKTKTIQTENISSLFVVKLDNTNDLSKSEINQSFVDTYSDPSLNIKDKTSAYTVLCNIIKEFQLVKDITCSNNEPSPGDTNPMFTFQETGTYVVNNAISNQNNKAYVEYILTQPFIDNPKDTATKMLNNYIILCKIIKQFQEKVQNSCLDRAEAQRLKAAQLRERANQLKQEKADKEKRLEEQMLLKQKEQVQAKLKHENEQADKVKMLEEQMLLKEKEQAKLEANYKKQMIDENETEEDPEEEVEPVKTCIDLFTPKTIPPPLTRTPHLSFVIIKKVGHKKTNNETHFELAPESEMYIYNPGILLPFGHELVLNVNTLYEINNNTNYFIIEVNKNSTIMYPKNVTPRIIEDIEDTGLSDFLDCYTKTPRTQPEKCNSKGLLGLGKSTTYFEKKYSFQAFVGVPCAILKHIPSLEEFLKSKHDGRIWTIDDVFIAAQKYVIAQPPSKTQIYCKNIENIYKTNGKRIYNALNEDEFKLGQGCDNLLRPYYLHGNNMFHRAKELDLEKAYAYHFSFSLLMLKVYNIDVTEMWKIAEPNNVYNGDIVAITFDSDQTELPECVKYPHPFKKPKQNTIFLEDHEDSALVINDPNEIQKLSTKWNIPYDGNVYETFVLRKATFFHTWLKRANTYKPSYINMVEKQFIQLKTPIKGGSSKDIWRLYKKYVGPRI